MADVRARHTQHFLQGENAAARYAVSPLALRVMNDPWAAPPFLPRPPSTGGDGRGGSAGRRLGINPAELFGDMRVTHVDMARGHTRTSTSIRTDVPGGGSFAPNLAGTATGSSPHRRSAHQSHDPPGAAAGLPEPSDMPAGTCVRTPQHGSRSARHGRLVRGQAGVVPAGGRMQPVPANKVTARPSTVGAPVGSGSATDVGAWPGAPSSPAAAEVAARPATVGSGVRRLGQQSGSALPHFMTPRGQSSRGRRREGSAARPVTTSALVASERRVSNKVVYDAARLTSLSARPATTGSSVRQWPEGRGPLWATSGIFAAQSWERSNMMSERQQLEGLLDSLSRARMAARDPYDRNIMEAYRQCFDRLVEQFRTCKPLLSRIKGEYDRQIQDKAQALERSRFLVASQQQLTEQTENIAEAIHAEHEHGNAPLRAQLAEALAKKKLVEEKLAGRTAVLQAVTSELSDLTVEKLHMQEVYTDLCNVMNRHGDLMDARYKKWEVEGAVVTGYREQLEDQTGESKYAEQKLVDAKDVRFRGGATCLGGHSNGSILSRPGLRHRSLRMQ